MEERKQLYLTGGKATIYIPETTMTSLFLELSTYTIQEKYSGFHPLNCLFAASGASVSTPAYNKLEPVNPNEEIWVLTYPYIGHERWYKYVEEIFEMIVQHGARVDGLFGLKNEQPWYVETINGEIKTKVLLPEEYVIEDIPKVAKDLAEEMAMIYAYDYSISHPPKSLIQSKSF